MNKKITGRELVMLCALGVVLILCAYYYLFYIPATEEIAALEEEYITLDEQQIVIDAKVSRMNEMKKELAAIESGEMGNVKPLPIYTNRTNVLTSLSNVMQKTITYDIDFYEEEVEENTIRRSLDLTYECSNYETAKSVLTSLFDGEYRCIFKDLNMNNEDRYCVSVEITFFEYME